MNRHYSVLSISLLFMVACTPQSSQKQLIVHETNQAKILMQTGQHKEAAERYKTLAESQSDHPAQFNLLAAEAYIQSGDTQSAITHLESINPTLLDQAESSKFNLIKAQIYLSNGQAEHALNSLSLTRAHYLSPADLIKFYQSQAFAHSLTGNILQSVQARIQLSPLLTNQESLSQNFQVILNSLNLIPVDTLGQYQLPAPNILGGWISLSRLLKSSRINRTPAEFQHALNQWQLFYPQHPANSDYLSRFLEGSKNNFVSASSIAVLLPESGKYSRAADVIKKGFMSAYHQSDASNQPAVRFYDSSSESSVNLYHRAVSEGADLIIGPLSKDNIQTLALTTELTTPVLALNHVQNLVKDNLLQFGLSPLDETHQISIAANNAGYSKVLLMTPNSKKGQRISAHLSENWQETGGTVLESQSYNSRENDFSSPIQQLLNLDESKYRYKSLRRFLSRNIEFSERRRDDVDAIFLSATAKSARSIYPQLRFYRASDVPVFATPEIYTGIPNPSLDIDLNNITFCDIPWLFEQAYPGDLSQATLRDLWQSEPNRYLRLIALGIDAHNLVNHLGNLGSTPYYGATGQLSMNMENRITRKLICAKFAQGKPVLQNIDHYQAEQREPDPVELYDQ